jgi:phosphate/sulfate permease
MMFSVCLASFTFIMTSSFSGMPISGTHTVVGALLGAGVVATGFDSLHWTKLGYIVLSWFVSPALAALVTLALMSLVAGYTMDTAHRSYRARLLSLQLIATLSFAIVADLLAALLGVGYAPKDPHTPAEIQKDLDKGLTHEHWYIQYWMLIMTASVLLVGTAVCRLLILSVLVTNSKVSFSLLQLLSFAMVAVFSPLGTELFEKLTVQIELGSDKINSEATFEEMQSEFDVVRAGLLQLKEHPQISFAADSLTEKEGTNGPKASVLNFSFKDAP